MNPAQMNTIPLYRSNLSAEALRCAFDVAGAGAIASGPNVRRFEEMLVNYIGNPLIITNGDVSTAITMALFQAGVRPDDDVLMSPLVCLATSCPVRNLFANIRWCDVNPLTGNLDPEDIPKMITSRTKAIVVYHWCGNPADLRPIQSLAREYNLKVIEDAGEALGAEYGGKRVGATGSDYTLFSFYPNRHLTTLEGGAIACANKEDLEVLQRLRRYGIHQPSFRNPDGEINSASDIPVAGWNSYMSHVGATIGATQMRTVPDLIARHQANGEYYDRELAGIPGITLLKRPHGSRSAYWVYTFLARDRDQLLQALRQRGVSASKVHLRNDIYGCFRNGARALPGVGLFLRTLHKRPLRLVGFGRGSRPHHQDHP